MCPGAKRTRTSPSRHAAQAGGPGEPRRGGRGRGRTGHGRGLQSWSGFLPAPSPSWQILNTLYKVNRTLKIAAPLGRAVSRPDSSRARRVPAAHPEPRAASLLLLPQSFRWLVTFASGSEVAGAQEGRAGASLGCGGTRRSSLRGSGRVEDTAGGASCHGHPKGAALAPGPRALECRHARRMVTSPNPAGSLRLDGALRLPPAASATARPPPRPAATRTGPPVSGDTHRLLSSRL